MKPVPYWFFQMGVDGLPVPRWIRKAFAKTHAHRQYIFGRLYSNGFLKRLHPKKVTVTENKPCNKSNPLP